MKLIDWTVCEKKKNKQTTHPTKDQGIESNTVDRGIEQNDRLDISKTIVCFHSRGQHLCKVIGTEESVCITKELNSHRTGLAHQHGRCSIVLGHQYGRHDIT